jgi:hypothetical protein
METAQNMENKLKTSDQIDTFVKKKRNLNFGI